MVEFKQKFNKNKTWTATKHQTKKLLPLILVLSAVLILMGIMGIALAEDNEGLYSGIFFIVFGVVWPLIFLVVLKIAQHYYNKSLSMLSDETEEVFTFDENCVTVSAKKGEDYEAYTKANYSYLFKVVETRENYFLYISRAQMHVLDKSCLTQGTLLELNSYFYGKLGGKFKAAKK